MAYVISPKAILSQAHQQAIGHVTSAWTLIEDTLERYIWFQISMGHEVGQCLTTYMSYPQRLEVVLTLTNDMFMPHRATQWEALRKFASSMTKGPYARRNDIVHATWELNEETGDVQIIKRKARTKLIENPQSYSVTEIEAAAKEIEEAFCRLNQLLIELEPPDQLGQRPPSWLPARYWRKETIAMDLVTKTRIAKPQELSETERCEIVTFVHRYGHVPKIKYVCDGVRNAHLVLYSSYNNTIVGTAVIKQWDQDHVERLFTKAKAKQDAHQFTYELGYVATHPDYLRRKIAKGLIEKSLKQVSEKPIYATVRSDNDKMLSLLEHFDFVIDGEKYASIEGHYNLSLLTRAADA